ncbi:DUF4112 domain-containing protein [Tateyamaria sp. 1078]
MTNKAADQARRIARLRQLADGLDSKFRIPGTSLRFGWDSVLGLVPGLGDAVTVIPAGIFIAEGWRMGARKRVLARMGVNSAIDFVLGGVPIIGDAFDLVFKANRRNLALLEREMGIEQVKTPHPA